MLRGVQNNPGKFVLENYKRGVVKRMESNKKRVASRERVRERCASAPSKATPSGHFSGRKPVRAAVPLRDRPRGWLVCRRGTIARPLVKCQYTEESSRVCPKSMTGVALGEVRREKSDGRS
jgi:hypothetical protein